MSSYSTNLGLELIANGDQDGTWGTTTNTNLGTLIEQAISGYVTYSCTGGTDTITIPNGTTGVARNMFIELTGTGGGTVVVPVNKKLYFIYNNTAAAVTVKVSGLTGVSVPVGAKIILVSNGTDIVVAMNYLASLTLGAALPVASGGTGSTAPTANAVVVGNSGGTGYSSVAPGAVGNALLSNGTGWFSATSTGSGNNVLATSPTLTTPTLTTPTVTNYIETQYAIGTVTATATIDLANGTVQTATLTASTACVFTMPSVGSGKSFVLMLKQAASTGNGSATFTGVKYNSAGTPVVTTTAGTMDIFTFVSDGTNWYGAVSQGYTP